MKKLGLIVTSMLLGLLCLNACNSATPAKPSESTPTQESSESEEELRNGYYENVEDEDGNIYTGWFKDGLYDGYGEMEYMTGTIYRGEWKEGHWEGVCYILWDSGCIYVGESGTEKSRMHGIGYMLWTMGDYYVGEWANGDPNGWGMKAYMVNAQGENHQDRYNIYMGTMKNNYKIGFGLMRYAGGDLYFGDWTADCRSGQGTVIFGGEWGGMVKFTGTFKNDWIDGEGIMYYSNGKVIHGVFDGTECVQVIEVINEGASENPEPTLNMDDQRAIHQAETLPTYEDSDRLLSWAHMMLGK